jgi:hypothetical protein
LVVAAFGARAALGCCVGAMLIGGMICLLWAPETKNARLDALAQVA